jgi:hypothetical protein
MCKVKRDSSQGLFAAPPVTNNTPSNVAPSATQTLEGTSTHQASSATATVEAVLPPFDYQNQKVRGVNLGGWFMMEVGIPLIYCSLF